MTDTSNSDRGVYAPRAAKFFAGRPPKLSQPARGKRKDADRRTALLVQAIEGEVIPRLMLAHQFAANGAASPGTAGAADGGASPEMVTALSDHLVQGNGEAGMAYVRELQANGLGLRDVFLEVIAPSARLLGELWERDTLNFNEVTIGLCRLHHILRELSADGESAVVTNGRRALLALVPGEQHLLGLIMVGEMLRRDGWDVTEEPNASIDDVAAIVRNEWFDLVGLSISCEERLQALASEITAVRRTSLNRNIGVIVGGRIFSESPDFAVRVGADATAKDCDEAAQQADDLVELLSMRASAATGG